MSPWLLLAASYLWGAIPSAYLAGKWSRGIDLREHGSGNLGATNTFRVLGAKVAAPVMVFDILKGFLPVLLFGQMTADWRWQLAYGAAAIVTWLVVLKLTRMVSAASLSGALALSLVLAVTPPPGGHHAIRWLGWAIAAFVFFSHRSNVRRIANGTEPRFGAKKEPEATVAAAALTADADEVR